MTVNWKTVNWQTMFWQTVNRQEMIKFGLVALLLASLTTGCATVQPWQKGDLAVAPMQVEDDSCHRFEHNIEAYREGAVGANGGKSGGGCGCA